MEKKILVLGDGGWGTGLSILLSSKGHKVTLWSKFPDYASFLMQTRENTKFLPGVKIPESVKIISIANPHNLKDYNIYVVAIPVPYLRNTLFEIKDRLDNTRIFVSVAKGIEVETLLRPSEIIQEITGAKNVVILSGPSFSSEVARYMPTVVSVSAKDRNTGLFVKDVFLTEFFSIQYSDDYIGVELAGALKNVVAIASGTCDGLNLAYNLKAFIVHKLFLEMMKLGIEYGARQETFLGISGLGDVFLTCYGERSRNLLLGRELGRGKKLSEILEKMEKVAEGVFTTKSAIKMAKNRGLELKVLDVLGEIMFRDKSPTILLSRIAFQ